MNSIRPWVQLVSGLLGIAAFVFVIAPMIAGMPLVSDVLASSRARGIDAAGLFYSDTPETAEAAIALRAAMDIDQTSR